MKEGSKYKPLRDYLRGSNQNKITLTFAEVEAVMNDILPNSAKSKRAWWSNRNKGALQAEAWMEAGFRVEDVDLDQQRVTFRKPPDRYQAERVEGTVLWTAELIKALRLYMGLTQIEFAKHIGVRQATVSQWEKGVYEPTLATSKYLTLIAEQAGFQI